MATATPHATSDARGSGHKLAPTSKQIYTQPSSVDRRHAEATTYSFVLSQAGAATRPASLVTPLVPTFYCLSLLCNVGQSSLTVSLPEMFFAARGKVMEMKEHSRSRGLPAKLPEALL